MIAISQRRSRILSNAIMFGLAFLAIVLFAGADLYFKGFLIAFLGLPLLIGFWGLWREKLFYKHIKVEQHKVSIKKAYQKTPIVFSKKDILYWMEFKYGSRSSEWNSLHVHTAQQVFKIRSYNYKNYEAIKRALTNGVKHNSNLEQKVKSNRHLTFGLFFASLALIFALQAQFDIFKAYQPLKKESLMIFDGAIESTPRYFKQRRAADKIILKVNNVAFEMSANAKSMYADKIELLLEKPAHSVFSFGISKYDYQSKILKAIPPSFYERYFDPTKIKILSLADEAQVYLDIEQTNKSILQANRANWLWALFLLIAALYQLVKYVQKQNCSNEKA